MSMANLLLYLPRLIKQGCCEEVLFAVRNYDPSTYGFVKTLSHLAFLPHEVAVAALRPLKRTRWPQFRAALRILQGPVHSTGGPARLIARRRPSLASGTAGEDTSPRHCS